MQRLGCEPEGIKRMVPKSIGLVIKLEGVRTPAALILKEEMLSKGGDAAIHRDCITGKVDRSDVLLMGSEAVLNRVTAALHAQPFSLPAIADEIRKAIKNYHGKPAVPQLQAIGERTLIMGILNVTPDSFSDGGVYQDTESAVRHGIQMAEDGADIIDIGGESSRPGSKPVSVDEELSRVIPVIQALAKQVQVPISIDTYKPEVARAALDAGAAVINDITGLADEGMRSLAAERKAPTVIMHMKGTPRNMQENPEYGDVVSEIMAFFRERIALAVEAGLPEEYLIIDPGIGFGKTLEHNLEIIRNLADFKTLGRPILIGTSRKAFIGKILGGLPPTERLEGTAATVAISIMKGANIVRVHDVKEMSQVAKMADVLKP
ncbi:MAG TPA: dihydropteroate synthase [Armatimonadota bacterium]|nr:dihydropteroate synthase [Armatimonadota bacterium]